MTWTDFADVAVRDPRPDCITRDLLVSLRREGGAQEVVCGVRRESGHSMDVRSVLDRGRSTCRTPRCRRPSSPTTLFLSIITHNYSRLALAERQPNMHSLATILSAALLLSLTGFTTAKPVV